ncbi:MAG: aspartate ammonia-lyase [Marine Group III euryarchaeote CG-Epi6]|uniref:fumarate hydratase n=1 Tax=Marine Group III euryarchaeote CG-Epi6 TaxID=1889000 RepID=A0A1J5T0L8_9ARCH|nr:MAG: aspartate ammonia-lyase [Marine Group III euryarchaeote CG-Epi6]
MGEMEVPKSALWGASTQRAILNFPISGIPMSRSFIRALGYIKAGAAAANAELGIIDDEMKDAIISASISVADGNYDEHFPVDVFQTGSGTSTNMNANEVIATLSSEESGLKIHPNDHVNQGQSSNDVIPSALHLSALIEIEENLCPALLNLQNSLTIKSEEFMPIIKTGRTHLMDATPIRLGQEFLGYAGLIERSLDRLLLAKDELSLLALGGTAVGTGVNTKAKFSELACQHISKFSGIDVYETDNHFLAQSSLDGALTTSGVLRGLAVSLQKIANDIRLMGSGPRSGIAELSLPAVQPGSSIMPGKVNPVIPEAIIQASSQAIACDTALVQSGQGGYFELNTMLPFAAHNLLQAVSLLSTSAEIFATKCIDGLEATEKGPELLMSGLMLATTLAPVIGYEKAAKIAKEAHKSGQTVLETSLDLTDLSEEELIEILNPEKMVKPND